MARSLRTAAVLSFCAILVPTGCDSPTSSPELQPSAAIAADGTVVTTTKDVVPVEGVVSGQCLNEGEPFAISGELGVVHHLTLTPASGGKTYLLSLDTQVWSEGIRLIGLQSATGLLAVGADRVEVTEEVTVPQVVQVVGNTPIPDTFAPLGPQSDDADSHLSSRLAVEIAEDFGVSTTLETVEIVCPPPDTDDGSIIVTKHDKLDVDTEVTTPCFNDGVDETVSVKGVLGVVHHLKLTPIEGMEYALDLSTVAWSQGIQLVGLASAAEALAVGADKVQVAAQVSLPMSLSQDAWEYAVQLGDPVDTSGGLPPGFFDTFATPSLEVEIAEDFGITTTLDGIEIICPPPPVVDG